MSNSDQAARSTDPSQVMQWMIDNNPFMTDDQKALWTQMNVQERLSRMSRETVPPIPYEDRCRPINQNLKGKWQRAQEWQAGQGNPLPSTPAAQKRVDHDREITEMPLPELLRRQNIKTPE